MNKTIQGRLTRLVEAHQERDAETVKGVITTFLATMTPDQLYECRQPDVCRERLWGYLADQSPRTLAIIERWAARKGEK